MFAQYLYAEYAKTAHPPLCNSTTIRQWMASNEDTIMVDPWNDSNDFIEDRNKRNSYIRREELSRWGGALPEPTFVFGIHAPLTGPVPRFTNFGVIRDYPEDNPGAHSTSSGTPTASAQGRTTDRGAPGRRTPDTFRSTSTTRSSDSRHYETPEAHDDVLRHRVLTSRDRLRDDPPWQMVERQCPRAMNYHGPDQRPRSDSKECERLRIQRHALNKEDRALACEANRARTRGTSTSPPLPDDEPPRTMASPNLRNYVRNADGHPQSPWAVRQASDDVGDDDCPARRPTRTPPVWRERNGRLLGRWYLAQIQTIEQAFNLCEFLALGQQESYELFRNIVHNLAAIPLEFRTEGEAYLMQRQQELEKAWWITISGAPRQPHHICRLNPYSNRQRGGEEPIAGSSHQTAAMQDNSRQAHRTYGPPPPFAMGPPPPARITAPPPATKTPAVPAAAVYTFGSAPAINPTPAMTAVAVKPPRGPMTMFCPETSQGFLGGSTPNINDEEPVSAPGEFPAVNARTNSRWTATKLMNCYTHIHPSQWGLGILDMLGHLAGQLGDTPRRDDVLAYHMIAILAGLDQCQFAHQYRLFFSTAVRLFSIEGFYAHILRGGEYPLVVLPMAHYPYLTDNITPYLVAAWITQHGIMPGSPENLALERFARTHRNMADSIENLDNREWNDAPLNAADAMSLAIPHYSVLEHAPTRSARGITASIHAPMEDVKLTGGMELLPSGITTITEPVEPLPAPPPESPTTS
ncbi:hypothetical protein DFH09DRAFT_1107804 [Mycena vulgaris]|nr:hypothetical protein DFH09DRAFT_1107804 [Mycena vulgaris]